MIIRFSLVLLVETFTGCVNPSADSPAALATAGTSGAAALAATSRPSVGSTRVAAADRLDEAGFDHSGDGVSAKGESITIASLATKTDEWAGKKIRLIGRVEAVCKNKGCWMVLADGGKKVRVRFRDYGFFVPQDCEEREAVLEGTFLVSKTSVAELKHLLEDQGKSAAAAAVTGPRSEMKVMADSVAPKKFVVAPTRD